MSNFCINKIYILYKHIIIFEDLYPPERDAYLLNHEILTRKSIKILLNTT